MEFRRVLFRSIMLWLLGSNNYDRCLLAAARQRRQQATMTLWPMHPKVLQPPLKLVELQPHPPHPLDNSTLRQVRSGIAQRDAVVSPHPHWNQYDRPSTGIARSAAVVYP